MLLELYKTADLQRLIAKYEVKYIININKKDSAIDSIKKYD